MIEELGKNIDSEIQILREISELVSKKDVSSQIEGEFIEEATKALRKSMKLINKSIPNMLRDISLSKKLPSGSKTRVHKAKLEKIRYSGGNRSVNVILNANDKSKFMKELSISESFIKKIESSAEEKQKYGEFKGSRGYVKYANKIFFQYANKWVGKGYFKSLSSELRKANIDILFKAYVSVVFFSTLLSFLASVILVVLLLFIDVSITLPFFSIYEGDFFPRLAKVIWIPLFVPIVTFVGLYFYPSSEKKSLRKRIDQELPFAVIHMSAIAGSGIEPSEIFKIIGTSDEYPFLKREIRKILNQINLYGYDLVTSLNNAAKTSPSEHLSELFAGLSSSITSGAKISDFLEKRSESLLLNYRLEREKYTKLVETFLDIYISIVIAAPMIFLLLLILMTVSGISVGFSSGQLSAIAVVGIALLNIFFIVFLHLKQPTY